jgi:superfamily II DNA or RNA helicase/SAM-dependent methyltransferase
MARKKIPKLHPFEYVGAYKLFEEERFLLADEMGMFKTAQAIFANSKFREKKKRGKLRTLIVSPTSVREHWARELQTWAHPRGDINLVYTEDMTNGVSAAKNADWTIVSYPTMSRLEETALQRLKNIGFHHVIVDEAHNAKNPDALRTRAIKSLADQADYVSLLSGTPIPNTMSDLYVLMSFLDPDEYAFDPERDSSDSENFRIARQSFIQLYVDRPQAVKELLHKKMLRRMASDYLSDHIPELHTHRVEIPLTGRHLETYQSIVEQEMNVGRKIMDLEKASLDPCLLDESLPRVYRGRDMSQKYDALDEIVEREMAKKDGKVLIFTGLKRGIINYLAESYEDYGPVVITGDTSTRDGVRENLRKQFQRDPDSRVMLATTTMHEGVDLTAATAVVDITIPWTPAEKRQRWKRSHRPGEVKKEHVDVYTLYTTVPGPQSSLEEAALGMLDAKEEIVSYLLKGMQISLEELKTYDVRTKVPTIVRAIQSPSKAIFQYFLKWRGVGSESADRRMQRSPEMSKYIADLYPSFSMARNASDIYVPIIKDIEKRKSLDTKVDIGCGPGMLGFFLDEPTIGVDINPDMIDVGRELYPDNELHVAPMHELPLDDRIADLTVCSLAFQMTQPKQERSQALREMSRILKRGGYSIITVPKDYMTRQNEKRFGEVAEGYGYTIKDHDHGIGPSKIDYYVLQKTHSAYDDAAHSLKWKGDPGRRA